MQSKFAHTLDVVRANQGFAGLGFKRAATQANAERTMMRFALEAYRNPALAAAIDGGVITDPKIVQVFHRLPSLAVPMVCRLELRLGRHLSRARADKLVRAYLRVTGQALPAPAGAPAAEAIGAAPSRPRQIPMPALPAIF